MLKTVVETKNTAVRMANERIGITGIGEKEELENKYSYPNYSVLYIILHLSLTCSYKHTHMYISVYSCSLEVSMHLTSILGI